MQKFGRHTDWASFADVDEFFEPNATYADALESGAMTLADVLEEVTAMPVRIVLNVDADPARTSLWTEPHKSITADVSRR